MDVDPRRLAEQHISLARALARRSRIPAELRDEAESAALLGLVEAARRWDPTRGVPFPAYAQDRIRGAIQDWSRQMDLLSRDDRRKGAAAPVLVTEVRHGEGATAALELVAGDDDPAANAAAAAEAQTFAFALWRLPGPIRRVLEGRAQGRTLAELGAELGVSEGRACQLEREGREILRQRHMPWQEPTEAERRAWFAANSPRSRRARCVRGHPLEGRNLIEYERADGRMMRTCRRCRQETLRRRRRAAGSVPIAKWKPRPHPGRKLGRADVLGIVEAIARGERAGVVAARYGVARRVVRLIATGESYREITRPRAQLRPRGMTEGEAAAVISLLSAGVRPGVIAKRMGVSPTTIWEVRVGRTFKHLPRPASYPEPTAPRNASRRLSVEQVKAILAALAAGEKGRAIAKRFGTSESIVSHIRLGHMYRDVPRPAELPRRRKRRSS